MNLILIGGNGLLGSYYLQKFIKKRYNVIVLDINNSNIKKFKNYKFIKCDVSNSIELRKKIQYTIKLLKKVDVLINNAAFTSELALKNNIKFDNDNLDLWQKNLDVNLTSQFISCNEVIKNMINYKSGKIINVSSLYGHISPNHNLYINEDFFTLAAYTASKAGVIGLTKWLASKYAGDGIVINSISPGGVFNFQSDTFVNKYESLNPSKKMANPEDIYKVISFLISNKSNYVIGQNLKVDGGHSIW